MMLKTKMIRFCEHNNINYQQINSDTFVDEGYKNIFLGIEKRHDFLEKLIENDLLSVKEEEKLNNLKNKPIKSESQCISTSDNKNQSQEHTKSESSLRNKTLNKIPKSKSETSNNLPKSKSKSKTYLKTETSNKLPKSKSKTSLESETSIKIPKSKTSLESETSNKSSNPHEVQSETQDESDKSSYPPEVQYETSVDSDKHLKKDFSQENKTENSFKTYNSNDEVDCGYLHQLFPSISTPEEFEGIYQEETLKESPKNKTKINDSIVSEKEDLSQEKHLDDTKENLEFLERRDEGSRIIEEESFTETEQTESNKKNSIIPEDTDNDNIYLEEQSILKTNHVEYLHVSSFSLDINNSNELSKQEQHVSEWDQFEDIQENLILLETSEEHIISSEENFISQVNTSEEIEQKPDVNDVSQSNETEDKNNQPLKNVDDDPELTELTESSFPKKKNIK
jgi:hypothetical protein